MIVIGKASPIPIHNINSGSQPIAGMGYKKLIIRFNISSIILLQPIIIPTTIPRAEPARNPTKTRMRLRKRWFRSTPLIVMWKNSCSTKVKGGRKKRPGIKLNRVTIPHSIISMAKGIMPRRCLNLSNYTSSKKLKSRISSALNQLMYPNFAK